MIASKFRGLVAAAVIAVAATALFAPLAHAATPAPGYTQFDGCPSEAENPKSEVCTRTVVDGGYFQMGSKNVPITKPITIVAGTNSSFEGFYTNSKGGMSKASQKVPGGVVGLTGLTWLLELLGSEALTLYAVTELAGTPDLNLFAPPIELPIKVHLVNSTLGNNCYVGSTSNPIKLNLTFGTTSPPPPNTPISGKAPEFSEEGEIVKFSNGTLVDNSFAAPGASGCVLTLFGFIPISLNGFVNEQAGLPSAAGNNATEENFNLELTSRERVYP